VRECFALELSQATPKYSPGRYLTGWYHRVSAVGKRVEASGMMVAVLVLMPVGVALLAMIWRLQAYLLGWQQHNMVE
jgi:hypothetical protein